MIIKSMAHNIRLCSLVPRFVEGEEKGSGTHYLCMLCYPKNLRGLNTIVFCLVYLPFDLNTVELVRSRSGLTFEQGFKVARETLSCMWIDKRLRTVWVHLWRKNKH